MSAEYSGIHSGTCHLSFPVFPRDRDCGITRLRSQNRLHQVVIVCLIFISLAAVLNGRGTQEAISQPKEPCFVEVWKFSSCFSGDCGRFTLIFRMHVAARIRRRTTRWQTSAFQYFFWMQSESFLSYQRRLEKGHGTSNCHSLFGMRKIPTDNFIRLMLDLVSPEALQPCLDRVIEQLRERDGLKVFHVAWPMFLAEGN
jgi:hypothetical protein